ncbi:AAA family ATPase [Nonomuraea fuscirosea]|uniref:AAA family ATPase n=1 Tax=Nonomuraea fuscirosea TaxID=1291556 RepID=UPI00340080F7
MCERVVLVNGLPGSGKSTLARALGRELGWPVLSEARGLVRRAGRGRAGPVRAAGAAPRAPGPLRRGRTMAGMGGGRATAGSRTRVLA